jgi:hypothetical protein
MSEDITRGLQAFIYDKINSKEYVVDLEDLETGLTRRFHLNLNGTQKENFMELMRMLSKSTGATR